MITESYAVFLSYNDEDRHVVEQIAVLLADKSKLNPWFDQWALIPGESWVRNLARGLEAASSCAVFVGQSGEGPWQKPEVETALQQHRNNPNYRVIPVLLPQAPQKPVLPPFLDGHTWVDFRNGLDDDNALWRLEGGIRGEEPRRGRPPQTGERQESVDDQSSSSSGSAQHVEPPPHFDPLDLIIPGGALDIDSRFYIARDTDEQVFHALGLQRALVTIRGARQTGKTSLIMRMYAALRAPDQQCRTAFVDLQALPLHEFQSLSTIWRAIAIAIAEQLQLDDWDDTTWQLDGSYTRQVSQFLDRSVFEVEKTPLLICLDEVDRVFHTPIRSEFFASLRAFYNRGALDPTWKQVRWLLGTASEPSFFIEDLTQSPFNIRVVPQ